MAHYKALVDKRIKLALRRIALNKKLDALKAQFNLLVVSLQQLDCKQEGETLPRRKAGRGRNKVFIWVANYWKISAG